MIGRDILETLTSSLYENPIIAFREYVQNSLDAYSLATKGKSQAEKLRVDITIDKKARTIRIKDNGYGIPENFEVTMRKIGNSGKSSDRQSIGFRGIGRLSGMPFCKTLEFHNKVATVTKTLSFTWNGNKYRTLLSNTIESKQNLEDAVSRITEFKEKDYMGNPSDHFFEVLMVDYDSELEDVINHKLFINNLSKLLPLKYRESFSPHLLIEEEYQKFFNKSLRDYMCTVYLDGVELTKPYDNKHVLDSKIQFWPIYIKTLEKHDSTNTISQPTGLIWFTFNKKITARKNDTDYGILVRSKNILMGGNDTFADAVNLSQEITTTYRELVQTLQGVYGELLIDSDLLIDNASRNWFKPDSNSKQLKRALVNFMKKLYKYRYASSKFLNSHGEEDSPDYKKKLAAMKEAFVSLLTAPDDAEITKWFENICNAKNSIDDKNEDELTCSKEDIPRQSKTMRKFYDELMEVIEEFFNKKDEYTLFLQMRAYIRQRYNKEE